jgi:hypothetical protein
MALFRRTIILYIHVYMQDVPGGRVSILRDHRIRHSKRDRAMDVIARMKERQDELRQATRHVLTRVAKCTDVDGEIFKRALC